jgi:hypothetical protein
MRRACLLCFSILVACANDDPTGASYERRVAAAEERVVEAICACLWTEELRDQCLMDTEKYLESKCVPQAARAFAAQYKAYAACLANTAEEQARCIEEADCKFHEADCARDALAECGPVPVNLASELAVCLPPFICATGQNIALTHRCNGVVDCFDRSDEAGCEPGNTPAP